MSALHCHFWHTEIVKGHTQIHDMVSTDGAVVDNDV
jgi:hypothetical protein